MDDKRNGRTVLVILIAATLCFIFYNSLQSGEDSGYRSFMVMRMLRPILEVFVGRGNVTLLLVRKLAHVFEFALLGLLLGTFALGINGARTGVKLLCAYVSGQLCALLDETVQIFSHRGSSVADIWIDSLGVVLGVLLALAVYAISRKSNE